MRRIDLLVTACWVGSVKEHFAAGSHNSSVWPNPDTETLGNRRTEATTAYMRTILSHIHTPFADIPPESNTLVLDSTRSYSSL